MSWNLEVSKTENNIQTLIKILEILFNSIPNMDFLRIFKAFDASNYASCPFWGEINFKNIFVASGVKVWTCMLGIMKIGWCIQKLSWDVPNVDDRQTDKWQTVKLKPVSYTHLDVYKRQLKYIILNNTEIFKIEIWYRAKSHK